MAYNESSGYAVFKGTEHLQDPLPDSADDLFCLRIDRTSPVKPTLRP